MKNKDSWNFKDIYQAQRVCDDLYSLCVLKHKVGCCLFVVIGVLATALILCCASSHTCDVADAIREINN